MATVSAEEYQSVLSELHGFKEKFLAGLKENQRLLGQISFEKQQTQQQHGELVLHVQQLEATIVAMQQQGLSTQWIHKEPKIGLPVKFDGTRSQFR